MSLRLISVTYGHDKPHSGGGKLYDYATAKEYRTGDNVVVPVTARNGKRYNTLATIRKTDNYYSPVAARKRKSLLNKDIQIKMTAGVGIRTLPGYTPNSQNWGGEKHPLESREVNYRSTERNGTRLVSRVD